MDEQGLFGKRKPAEDQTWSSDQHGKGRYLGKSEDVSINLLQRRNIKLFLCLMDPMVFVVSALF